MRLSDTYSGSIIHGFGGWFKQGGDYALTDKKRSEGKPYYVYMTAAANKFLRIYYARVKEILSTEEESANEPA